jgi:phosphopantothenoylcysteine decarboxylase/phosphopantothenate--cysteine ligase
MKCIVTAGPTYEELDQVRRLTNFSTGTLGTELANYLVKQGHTVTLLRGYYATCDVAPRAQKVGVFTTTADLSKRLQALSSGSVGAVFHAAAVSDFGFGKVWRQTGGGKLTVVKSGKFTTRDGTLLAELKPTPKVIKRLRRWFPNAALVGWKYEIDGTQADAVARARRQLEENKTDVCVANGPAYGKGFGLVEGCGCCHHAADKTALFNTLARLL